ncbi:MAG: glycosyltransferase [Bacteroidales bacterium]|jgi:glycosyltransferase involved in cell wall biosynthesis|nr:glycosyltransferase [Bacteroidales bacterium]MDD3100754.1 glycosyltransferase [Bacteroidales bacterium]MDD3639794.1 glycosyltransferase [Bacteroidales bacterium]MDD3944374.1 glycosyltransferase [Bacteroidales bacterium]MDD4480822.1 glycosyltransferase [Bacteroidales bacterium]
MDWSAIYQEPLFYLVTFGLLCSITLLHFLQYARPAFGRYDKNGTSPEELPGISVVLCVKNEYDNLSVLLPALLEQEYGTFEIVVVDKNSQDDTDVLLASLEHFHKNLTIRVLSANTKFGQDNLMALGIGVRAARHPLIVFFRPDCRPASKKWLSSLVKTKSGTGADVIMGYTSCDKCNPVIRYDMLEQQLHAMGMSGLKQYYAAGGNNTLFSKEKFIGGHEFDTRTTAYNQSEQAIVSHVLEGSRTRSCIYPAGTVILERHIAFREYHMTRLRSMQTILLTKGWPYLYLTMDKLLTALFYIFLVFTSIRFWEYRNCYTLATLGGMLLLRWVTVWIHHAGFRKHLTVKGLVPAAPLWDVLAPWVHFYFITALVIKKIKD